MTKILVPVDGSEHAERAVAEVLQRGNGGAVVHLLSVPLPVDGNVRTFVNAEELANYYREEGLATLAGARKLLEGAGIPHEHHILVGHPADVICRYAAEGGFDEIVMGTRGRTGVSKLVMGSVATEVSKNAKTRVTLVK